MCICYFGKKAIDIMSFVNIFIQHSAICNQKIQGNSCYLTNFFFTGFKSFNSDSVLCSRVFWSGTIVSTPFVKGDWRWVIFSKLAKRGKGLRASRILILKRGLLQVGWGFPILLYGSPKNNLSFGLQHLEAYWPETSANEDFV